MGEKQPTQDAGAVPPPHYRLLSVMISTFVFYAVCVMFDAKGLYGWASKLPVTDRTLRLKRWTESHWANMAAIGLENPKYTAETAFLDFQEAHHLLYPKKYDAMIAARRAAKAKPRASDVLETAKRSEPTAPKEIRAAEDPASGPRVLILGDSIMVNVGPVIKKAVDAELEGEAEVKARVSTGLARPDVFDWRRELRDAVSSRRYDVIVMMLGTNDSQDFADHGKILTYGSTEWVKTYNERIATMMETSCKGAKRAVWLGLPPMQSRSFNRKIVRINSWAKRQATKFSCVEYMPLENVIGDDKGSFIGYRRLGRSVEKIRMVDGIHITAKGGTLISKLIVDLIGKAEREPESHVAH